MAAFSSGISSLVSPNLGTSGTVMEVAASILIAMLTGRIISGMFRDISSQRNKITSLITFFRTFIGIWNKYYAENSKLLTIWLIGLGFLIYHAFQVGNILVVGSIFFCVLVAQLANYAFRDKRHSDVEVSNEIELNKCNIGRSSAMPYLFNYLHYVLPHLQRKLMSYEMNRTNPADNVGTDAVPDLPNLPIVIRKLFILIPKSGNNDYPSLCKADANIKFVTTRKINETNKSGHKKREYTSTVYRIEKPEGNYEFVAEFATPLTAIYALKISSSSANNVDQVEIFYQSLVELLHKHKTKYGDVCCVLYYDDTRHSISDCLYREITKEVYDRQP